MNKQILRDNMKDKLLKIDEKKRWGIGRNISRKLFQTDLWQDAQTIGITISHGFEWNTEPIIRQGWREGKRMVVPKCIPAKKELHFYQLTNYDQLEVVYLQLREPNIDVTKKIAKDEIDLLIVPGIVFDRKGFRIGFGGGYYDRFLTDFPNQTASLLYSGQLIENIPSESYDIPVQTMITENGFIQ